MTISKKMSAAPYMPFDIITGYTPGMIFSAGRSKPLCNGATMINLRCSQAGVELLHLYCSLKV